MDKKKYPLNGLTRSELKVMEAMWKAQKWVSIRELCDYFNEIGIAWKRQTMNTFLVNLINKGFVVRDGRKYIYAYTKAEYDSHRAVEIIDTYYNGSLKNFIMTILEYRPLDPEEAQDLMNYLSRFSEV